MRCMGTVAAATTTTATTALDMLCALVDCVNV
jgi:hypothetical protein